MKLLVASSAQSVILFTIVVLLEVCLKPLTELEVVKILALHELGNINMTLNAVLIKGNLQTFVVLDEFVLMLGAPFHSVKGEGAWIE